MLNATPVACAGNAISPTPPARRISTNVMLILLRKSARQAALQVLAPTRIPTRTRPEFLPLSRGGNLSGWGDSNSRPRRPERRTLTGLRYTPRQIPSLRIPPFNRGAKVVLFSQSCASPRNLSCCAAPALLQCSSLNNPCLLG